MDRGTVGVLVAGIALAMLWTTGAAASDAPETVSKRERRGFAVGFGAAGGLMRQNSAEIQCPDCAVKPMAGFADFHVGGMLGPRLALLFEVWGQGQILNSHGTNALLQTMYMGAAQLWLSHTIWLKGGVGMSSLFLSQQEARPEQQQAMQTGLGNGVAYMGALGLEMMHSTSFAIDLQLRAGLGRYQDSSHVSSGAIGIGLSWY